MVEQVAGVIWRKRMHRRLQKGRKTDKRRAFSTQQPYSERSGHVLMEVMPPLPMPTRCSVPTREPMVGYWAGRGPLGPGSPPELTPMALCP
ncbi:hypothetical protein GE061_001878 [Apolygus lucorum]|uniref:Uncharacterized protein n=1 Tax=Apolygus lucorum TaxID=248454 RepID=A0A8S9X648_APOLU|nr:hypothetical protein GE061_001878 [Apolygus lucorum]